MEIEQFSTALIPTRKGGGTTTFAGLRFGAGGAAAGSGEGLTADAVVPDFAGSVVAGAAAGLGNDCLAAFVAELACGAGAGLDGAGSGF